MRNGEVPIYEPGLNRVFDRAIRDKRLEFTTDLEKAFKESDIIFLCLPTPPGADGQADLSFVLDVAENLGDLFNKYPGYKVIVNKSTVPVGTADKVTQKISDKTDEEFDVVSNPEFLREGAAVEDFMKPERVVIGTSSEKAAEIMTLLYEPFVRQGNPIVVMDERSSEMTKYAANAFLATKITFMNEVANLCERVGANVDKIRIGVGLDSRIGKQFLYPGIGFGGSCFPKDVQALDRTSDEYGYRFEILKSVLDVNDRQRRKLIDVVKEYYGGDVAGKHFAVWGLSFKPNTDDVREAPSHIIIEGLVEAGATISAYDPEAIETTRAVLGDIAEYSTDDYGILEGADALIICTEWNEFRRPNFDRIKSALKEPVIFDGRNLYDPQRVAEAGFHYYSIGRPTFDAVRDELTVNGRDH